MRHSGLPDPSGRCALGLGVPVHRTPVDFADGYGCHHEPADRAAIDDNDRRLAR
jgi:hypothetical protein